MINYIRHDEEYHFIVKLVSGEQIIGKGFAIEEDETTQVFISDPVEIEIITRHHGNNTIKGVAMNKWVQFSDEEFFVLNEKDIITIAGLSTEMIHMYELFIKKSSSGKTLEDEIKDKEVELDSEMGLRGTVEEVRKRLEKIFKES